MNDLSLFFVRHNRHAPMPISTERPISYYDLTIVLEGSLQYTVDGKPFTLLAGDAILIAKGMLRARDAVPAGVDYISFNFHTDTPISLPILIKGAVQNDTKLMIAACDELVRHRPLGYEPAASHLVSALLHAMESHLKEASVCPLTAKIVPYLQQNIAQHVTLADIGKLTFFSPVYCDTVFKKDMGVSIIDYLLGCRIAEAQKLLIEGTLPLAQIARQTGFGDSNYFSRVFKKRTGYTPTEYKKTYCAN